MGELGFEDNTYFFIGTIASRRLKGQKPLGSSQVLGLEEILTQPLLCLKGLYNYPKKKPMVV